MRGHNTTVLLALLVAAAGVVGFVGGSQPSGEAVAETPTTTEPDDSRFPPGVSSSGITNASALLSAHTAALVETGFVVNSSANMTAKRSGFLVDVEANGESRATENATEYRYVNRATASSFTRLTDAYSNGSTEFVRKMGFRESEPEVTEKPRRPESRLTGEWALEPLLLGGDYDVTEVNETENGTFVTLSTDTVENETALLEALPESADEVRFVEATTVVDDEGRVHSMDARVGYVIDGENATLDFSYQLSQVGNVTVERPDWVDEADGTEDGSNGMADDPVETGPAAPAVQHSLSPAADARS